MVEAERDQVAARLGDALRKARASVDVSQAELARRLGVIPQELNRWESGRRRISLETLVEAEQALGVRAGTVLRLAGYVDDGGLIDVATLAPWAQRSVSLIIESATRSEVAPNNDGDGAQGSF